MAKRPSPIKQARAIIAPQYAPLKAGYAASTARSLRETQAAQAARLALVKQLQAGVAPAGATYDAAVEQTQALAQQGAHELAQANPNAQVQADLTAVNAPPEQRAQLAAQMGRQFGGQGAVLNVLQGTIPGAGLEAQKAATQQFMAGLPTVASLAGEQTLRGLAEARRQAAEQYAQQRLQVGAQLPGLATDIANRREDVGFRERQFANDVQQAALARQEAAAQRQFQARQAQLDRIAQSATTPYQQAQLKLAYDQLAADKQAAQQQSVTSPLDVYKAQTDRINAQRQRREATQTAKTGGKSYKPPSPKDLQEQADLAYFGKPPLAKDASGHPVDPDADGAVITSPGVKAVDYQTALFGMMNSGVKLAVAQRYLNQFYAPGERGRPERSFQQRQATKRPAKKRKRG